MAATHQAAECEIALDPVLFRFSATVEERLHCLPRFLADQRRMSARIGYPVPVEIAAIDAFPKDLGAACFCAGYGPESSNLPP